MVFLRAFLLMFIIAFLAAEAHVAPPVGGVARDLRTQHKEIFDRLFGRNSNNDNDDNNSQVDTGSSSGGFGGPIIRTAIGEFLPLLQTFVDNPFQLLKIGMDIILSLIKAIMGILAPQEPTPLPETPSPSPFTDAPTPAPETPSPSPSTDAPTPAPETPSPSPSTDAPTPVPETPSPSPSTDAPTPVPEAPFPATSAPTVTPSVVPGASTSDRPTPGDATPGDATPDASMSGPPMTNSTFQAPLMQLLMANGTTAPQASTNASTLING